MRLDAILSLLNSLCCNWLSSNSLFKLSSRALIRIAVAAARASAWAGRANSGPVIHSSRYGSRLILANVHNQPVEVEHPKARGRPSIGGFAGPTFSELMRRSTPAAEDFTQTLRRQSAPSMIPAGKKLRFQL